MTHKKIVTVIDNNLDTGFQMKNIGKESSHLGLQTTHSQESPLK